MSKWTTPSQPIEIKMMPWLAPDAIAYFEGILKPEYSVLEFGGGGSTLWLMSRVKRVITCENKMQWAAQIKRHIKTNVMLLNSADPPDVKNIDVLFIDGEPVAQRGVWMEAARDIVKDGGWIVADNANRPEYEKQRKVMQKHAELVHTVTTQGGRYFVTEFYRMRHA